MCLHSSQAFSKYVGLKYADKGRTEKGLDCWGLARHIYKEELGIILPSFTDSYSTSETREEIAAIIEFQKMKWEAIPSGKEQPFDIILLRILGIPMHIGVVIEKRKMIHVFKGSNTTIENYTSAQWRHRVLGFYRYKEGIR